MREYSKPITASNSKAFRFWGLLQTASLGGGVGPSIVQELRFKMQDSGCK